MNTDEQYTDFFNEFLEIANTELKGQAGSEVLSKLYEYKSLKEKKLLEKIRKNIKDSDRKHESIESYILELKQNNIQIESLIKFSDEALRFFCELLGCETLNDREKDYLLVTEYINRFLTSILVVKTIHRLRSSLNIELLPFEVAYDLFTLGFTIGSTHSVLSINDNQQFLDMLHSDKSRRLIVYGRWAIKYKFEELLFHVAGKLYGIDDKRMHNQMAKDLLSQLKIRIEHNIKGKKYIPIYKDEARKLIDDRFTSKLNAIKKEYPEIGWEKLLKCVPPESTIRKNIKPIAQAHGLVHGDPKGKPIDQLVE